MKCQGLLKTDMKKQRIFVAGHCGMVGSALVRLLRNNNDIELVTRTHDALDLLDQHAVFDFFKHQEIDQVYLAAAKVGGIHANNIYPAQFIYENLMIQANVIHAAHVNNVQKLLFLGSSCIYPKLAKQPIKEQELLTGLLEPTNEPYAVAKIAGIKLCESYNRQYGRDYRCLMPTNLYGPQDNFHPENSHVLPALMRRFHEAARKNQPEVVIWGTGQPKREFLHVDDLAAASVFVMGIEKGELPMQPMLSHINVGTGIDCTIDSLSEMIAEITGFSGKIRYDATREDGAPRKLLDVSQLRSLGWEPSIALQEGLLSTYQWFLAHENEVRYG